MKKSLFLSILMGLVFCICCGWSAEIAENFDALTDAGQIMGSKFGNPSFSIVDEGAGNSKALLVSDRSANYFGYSYNLNDFIGGEAVLSAKVAAYGVSKNADNTIMATIKTTTSAGDSYNQIGTVSVKGTDWAEITGKRAISADATSAVLYFEAAEGLSYLLDDVSITGTGRKAAAKYVDTSSFVALKDLYNDYFTMNVACEALSHWGGYNQLSEIGNPAKEKLILEQFNGITFGNELKPDTNMGYNSPDATESYLPFVIDSSAKEMLDWAKANGIKVRGHVLVWHSQCPDAVFCKDYKPVYKGSALDPACLVSREVMLDRMKSYIDSVMFYMYKNGYADVITAWDVVNEAIEPGTNEWNLRDSYWYKTIGSDFVYWAFKYARSSSERYAARFSDLYDFNTVLPKLFYNDYNEFQESKCTAIIKLLTEYNNGHSITGEGLIDGIGMQSHLSDNTNIDAIITALNRYDAVVDEINITELDVAQTSSGANADYYQAVFYNQLFSRLIEAKKNGANLTAVTVWGLTDDNSWKKESSPLLFNGDLSAKMAFQAVVSAITGDALPEPEYVKPDFSDFYASFDAGTANDSGFSRRGDSVLAITNDSFRGNGALLVSGRTASWNGAAFEVSRFAGQTICINAWVRTADDTVTLTADIDGVWPNIVKVQCGDSEWHRITGTYSVPADMNSLKLYYETNGTADILIDDAQVKLVGITESFENSAQLFRARGSGHVPALTLTGSDKTSGNNALLVTRSAKDATISTDVSKYIGYNITVSFMAKSSDNVLALGIDGVEESRIETSIAGSGWKLVKASIVVPNTLSSAQLFIETDGSADLLIDDFSITIADMVYKCDTDGVFHTRWGGAGALEIVEENGNKTAVLKNRAEGYYGIAFEVSPYLGREVAISADIKTDDSTIVLSGDIADLWPNYLREASAPGQYKTVTAIVRLPNDMQTLTAYFETDGTSDLYADNLIIHPLTMEESLAF